MPRRIDTTQSTIFAALRQPGCIKAPVHGGRIDVTSAGENRLMVRPRMSDDARREPTENSRLPSRPSPQGRCRVF